VTRSTQDIPNRPPPSGFVFGTKGETLALLAERLHLPKLCGQLLIEVAHWRLEKDAVIAQILARFGDASLAVRSSARSEDGWDRSNAGTFVSVIGVEPVAARIAEAVDRVVASFDRAIDSDQILIQPMVRDAVISGVVLTRDLDTGGPYYVINYDDFSGRTDTVTQGAESKTILVHRSRPEAVQSPRFRRLIDVVREIESATTCQELDIEFCITADMEIYVLQVRPLAAKHRWSDLSDHVIDESLAGIRDVIAARLAPEPGIAGRTTILTEMSDWNPAEMIGNAPRPLALALYRYLITDETWSRARAEMGYRPVNGKPLLIALKGRPYVDVRLSLNSFLPHGLSDDLAGRLIDHQLACLAGHPEYHDKIEFEIALSCRDFSFTHQRRKLNAAGFGPRDTDEIGQRLLIVTAAALQEGGAGLRGLLAKTANLTNGGSEFDRFAPRERAERLLSNCIPSGTLPFSQLARHAFIGVALLRSLVARDALSQTDVDAFMRGIETVATSLVRDMYRVSTGDLDEGEFLDTYGHLRPGTYDILSWRYDERPDMYLGSSGRAPDIPRPFTPTPRLERAVGRLLTEEGFRIEPQQLFDYIAVAVQAREAAKFAFTRSISDALVELCRWGESSGLSREDVSYLSLDQIFGDGDPASLKDAIAEARERHLVTRTIRLPHFIAEPDDIDVVRLPLGQPNFITDQSVTAATIRLAANQACDIDGRIVLIESADPGYDWIFSHEILGLVAKFGGANSHMAIRSAEFGLPAAIGCGERMFETLAKGSAIELNCAARTVKVVSG
jgi:hypothetical protein